MWPTVSHESQFEILKQRYESLEKTLSNVEKEKQYFQVESTKRKNDIVMRITSYLIVLEFIRTNEKRFRTYRRKVFESKKINQRTSRSVRSFVFLVRSTNKGKSMGVFSFSETDLRDQQKQIVETNEQQQRRIVELTKKVRRQCSKLNIDFSF